MLYLESIRKSLSSGPRSTYKTSTASVRVQQLRENHSTCLISPGKNSMKSGNTKFLGMIPTIDAENSRVFPCDQLPCMPKTYIARFKSRITNSNRPYSRCSEIQFPQFGQKSGSSALEGIITKYIIDLRSILSKRDSCGFCRLLSLVLCLP